MVLIVECYILCWNWVSSRLIGDEEAAGGRRICYDMVGSTGLIVLAPCPSGVACGIPEIMAAVFSMVRCFSFLSLFILFFSNFPST